MQKEARYLHLPKGRTEDLLCGDNRDNHYITEAYNIS